MEILKQGSSIDEKPTIHSFIHGTEETLYSPELDFDPIIKVEKLTVHYGTHEAVRNVTLDIARNAVTSLIGVSGCGKSTVLRSMNRLSTADMSISGRILLRQFLTKSPTGEDDIQQLNVERVRRSIGMVFQKPNPFPQFTIYDNVAMGPRLWWSLKKKQLDAVVEDSLRRAGLFEEVKDFYTTRSGAAISGGQQQRLCIARAIALRPEVLLMDEPTSALDPKAAKLIEQLIRELSATCSIVIVTHNMEQAARISDYTAFMNVRAHSQDKDEGYHGILIEYGPTKQLFNEPASKETTAYISGAF